MTKQNVSIPPVSLPLFERGTNLISEPWYRFFETLHLRTGGIDVDKVDDAYTGSGSWAVDLAVTNAEVALKADKTITISPGNGLTGGGSLASNRTFDAKKDTGWTAASGTSSKGIYASYAGHVASVGYVQAEVQATDDAVKALSQRIIALELALRANGAIDG